MTDNKGDLISREALKKSFEDTVCIEPMPYSFVKQIIDNAPTVEPCYQTTSCLDCKMYDKEKHNCPRFCEVIRSAIEERPQGEWLEDKVAFHFVCNQCGCALRQLKSEVFEGDYDYNFCPNCGASMKPKPNQLRDCENCIHHSENGCEVWECEFKRRSS